jgi:hypothetical protein
VIKIISRQFPTGGGEPPSATGRATVPEVDLISVVGPPAVGESTLTVAASDVLPAEVVRLRDLARRPLLEQPARKDVFRPVDVLGRYADMSARARSAFLLDAFLLAAVILLDDSRQRHHPTSRPGATRRSRRPSSSDGRAHRTDEVLVTRSRAGRVCPQCEPTCEGDPRRPARAMAGHPGRCGRCAGQVAVRRPDEDDVFGARLRRFRVNQFGLRTAARVLGVPHEMVDATRDPAHVWCAFGPACASTLALEAQR